MDDKDGRSLHCMISMKHPSFQTSTMTMKILYTIILSLPMQLAAQTTWPVSVGGSTSGPVLPFYDPQFLTIEVGDIVQWTNTSGTHNVSGTLTLYPNNPEGFSSGAPASGGWTFSHTFTIPGFYEYRCTQTGHGATQFGTITVMDGTGLEDREAIFGNISLYPVPAVDVLTLEISDGNLERLEVFDLEGRIQATHSIQGKDAIRFPVDQLPAGQYYLRLYDAQGRTVVRPFRKG